MQLFSFDIFDTVVYRKVSLPSDIFKIMERMFDNEISKHFVKSFKYYRVKAEEMASRRKTGEINFDDIYKELGNLVSLNDQEITYLKDLELRVERECIFLNKVVLNEIKRLKNQRKRVILISDMYLPRKEIEEILVSLDPVFNGIMIYVSSEMNASKKDGGIYKKIKKIEKVNYSDWVHVGDNIISDIYMANILGIKTVHQKHPYLFDYEKKIVKNDLDTSILSNIIIKNRKTVKHKEYNLGISFAGPLIYEYVDWLLKKAQEEEIKQLYFILRDGYILKKVADLIIECRMLDIKTKELYSSRIAWRFPSLTIEKLERMSVWDSSNWIFHEASNIYCIFRRLHFTNQEVDEIFGETFGNRIIKNFKEFKLLLRVALNNKIFVDKLNNKITESKRLLKKYFEQEINFCERFAFVDTNSTGKTQNELSVFFEENFGYKALTYFYYTFLSQTEEGINKFAFDKEFAFDKRLPEGLLRAPMNVLIEYKENEHIYPVFFESEFCSWNYSFDFDEYLKGILDFVLNVEVFNKKLFQIKSNKYYSEISNIASFRRMSKDINRIIGSIPFNVDVKGNEILDFYPKIKFLDLFKPFSRLIYRPKGSFYMGGIGWILLYKFLSIVVLMLRRKKGIGI